MSMMTGPLGDTVSAVFSRMRMRATPGCRVLMYHAVGGPAAGDARGLYSLSPGRFAEHVRRLAQIGGVRPLDAAAGSGEGVAITFDDGYRDNMTVAAPLLADAGLPFTVFVTPDFVRSGARHYLSPDEVRQLAQVPGAAIGAHGRSHRRLTQCSDAELAAELHDSKAWLEDLLGKSVETMSFPHGATDARVRTAAAAAGYALAACSRFGAHPRGGDPLGVARVEIWANDSSARLSAKLRGDWDWLAWRHR